MKNKKATPIERLFLVLAILLISAPFIIKHYRPMPDSLYGFIVGAGIGIELLILIKIAKRKSGTV